MHEQVRQQFTLLVQSR